MDKIQAVSTWMPVEVSLVGIIVLIIMFSLGFTLWRSLFNTNWALYWHISSFFTAFGAFFLAISASRVVTNNILVGSAFAVVVLGVVTAMFGAIMVTINYLRFR